MAFTMSPSLRKLNLTAHVTTSVGWLGAVAGFLVLSIAGLSSSDTETVRGAYLTMNLLGQYLIVPLSLAALGTGLLQSLGTHWGLFRYRWVLTKFILTTLATVILLLHQFTAVAGAAKRVSGSASGTLPKIGGLGVQLVTDAALAVLVLLMITALSVYKPWGRTAYGRQQLEELRSGSETLSAAAELSLSPSAIQGQASGLPLGLKIFLAVMGLFLLAFILQHLGGGGLHQHGMWMAEQLAGLH